MRKNFISQKKHCYIALSLHVAAEELQFRVNLKDSLCIFGFCGAYLYSAFNTNRIKVLIMHLGVATTTMNMISPLHNK